MFLVSNFLPGDSLVEIYYKQFDGVKKDWIQNYLLEEA